PLAPLATTTPPTPTVPLIPTPAAGLPTPPAPPRVAPVRRRSRWPLALAAALILALLGLSGYLYQGLRQQGETIGRLTQERDQLIAQEREHAQAKSASEAELARMQGEMTDLQARLAFMTTPGVEISPLRPTGRVPLPADAFGMLFVAADHQHWHLAIKGLDPSGAGRQYQLWFIAPQGAVSGGTFTAAPGAPVHLSSAHMPPGTRAVIITLEPEAGTEAPTGPEVLRAAAPVKVL
ncbi:MAG TPA: anti-sigma factor, partial [Thermoanaerobaculia bacterium]|nr:anti-sigma factor [Thermoanaerobaculia bacterium]